LRHADFVSLDDPTYVSENPHVKGGLTWSGVVWAFTSGRAANWHPLTWLSHMLDVQLYGVQAGPHHVTSVALHCVNALLLFLVLARATGARGRSALVAALFAVHPLHVESVAWIAERKDVLSTAFWMLTLWAYVGYVRQPRWHRYGLVIVLFALGLMAKPMLVTLPFVLLLLDIWPLGRVAAGAGSSSRAESPASWRAWLPLVREKLPLIALAAMSSLVTFLVQQRGGAVPDRATFPLAGRAANALVAYVAYIGRALWPSGLTPFYPYPQAIPIWSALGALAGLVVVSAFVVRATRRRPYLAVGWFWYLGTLVPVIGLIQVGMQATADRYTYVPLTGLFIVVAWGVPDVLARWRASRSALPSVAVLVLLALVLATRAQAGVWTNSLALWQHALDVAPDNYYAHNALGALQSTQGRAREAVTHFTASIRLAPTFPDARNNLGLALAAEGHLDEAIAQYQVALQLAPTNAEAHNNLGAAFARRGRLDEAAVHYGEAIALDPDAAAPRNNLGQILKTRGKTVEAIAQYREALRLDPASADVYNNLGLALYSQGKPADAIAQYTEALRLDPASADAHNNLALALMATSRLDEAVRELVEALRLQPDNASVHSNLGFALVAQGRMAEAIPRFTEAVRLQPDLELAHQYLGSALASTGRFDEAIRQFTEVLRLNPKNEGARRALDMLTTRHATIRPPLSGTPR
jgi:Flp pilus assembly protein TadD